MKHPLDDKDDIAAVYVCDYSFMNFRRNLLRS